MNQSEYWVRKYIQSGRVAFYHPRKHTISLGGGMQKPEKDQIESIKLCLANDDMMLGTSPHRLWNGKLR